MAEGEGELALARRSCRTELELARETAVELRSLLPSGVPPWLLLVLERQEGINRAHSRVNALNIAGRMMLVARIEKLQSELERRAELTDELERWVGAQQQSIQALEADVAELALEGDQLRAEQRQMKAELEAERDAMRRELGEQQAELERHRRELDSSRAVIDRLRSLCVGQDLVVDAGIVLCAAWLSSFRLVALPVRLIAGVALGGRGVVVARLLRLATVGLIAHCARRAAIKYRLHGRVGSLGLYAQLAAGFVRDSVSTQHEPPPDNASDGSVPELLGADGET